MDQPWEVRAVWQDRGGTPTERRYQFKCYGDFRREVVRLFCHLGLVDPDERALIGLSVRGDFWSGAGMSP